MVVMKYFIYIVVITAVLVSSAYSEDKRSNSKIIFHSEFSFFNRAYKSLEFDENNETFFPVSMVNLGGEFHHKSPDGSTFGGGVLRTVISEGRTYNFNHYEIQPHTEITLPYFFAGNDFGLMAAEIGMSYYFTFERCEFRNYLLPGGNETEKEAGGIVMNRSDSHVLFNLMIRVLPEDRLHFKIRFGRERFNAVDSLFNVAGIYPYKNHIWEIYMSLPTGFSSYFPESNQRFGVVYSFCINPITIGITTGYLSYNRKGGGDGNMPLFDRNNFSYGVTAGLAW